MKKFVSGIIYTVKAFIDMVLTDIYLRVELAAVVTAAFFAYAFDLDRTGWAVLAVASSAAIAMQLLYAAFKNTEYGYGFAAASAVVAAGALLACMLLFYDKEAIKMAFLNIIYSPRAKLCFAALFVIDVLFVAWFEKNTRGEKNEK